MARGNGAMVRALKVQHRSLMKSKAMLEKSLASETAKYDARKAALEGHIASVSAELARVAGIIADLGGDVD